MNSQPEAPTVVRAPSYGQSWADIQHAILLLRPLSLRPQSSGPWSPDRYACSPTHGPRTTAPGPLLEGRETRCPNRIPVTRLVLPEQPAANQQPDATLANLDRRNHDHAP